MKFWLPKLAFRNLTRYRKRTLITAGAIAYGLIMFIVTRSILIGIDSDSENNLRLYETADGRIMLPGIWEDRMNAALEDSFNPAQAADLLEEAKAQWAPRTSFTGNLIFYKEPFPEDGSIPGRFVAIDPEEDNRVFPLKETLTEGRWFKDNEYALLIGRWLAEDIGAEIGASVVVETRDRDGFPQSFDLEIVGFLDCPNPEVTRSGMFMPLSTANECLGMNGAVTEINVRFPREGRSERAFDELSSRVYSRGLEAVSWQTLGADFIAMSRSKSGATGFIILLMLIIAGVGISNTMLMAVYERVRELGMMRALGMKNSQVKRLFLWEAAGIGLLGGVMGCLLGTLATWPLVRWGIDYSFLLRDSSFGYRIQGQMYGAWDLPTVLLAFVMGVGMTVLVAVFSTGRILRLDIPGSLRFN